MKKTKKSLRPISLTSATEDTKLIVSSPAMVLKPSLVGMELTLTNGNESLRFYVPSSKALIRKLSAAFVSVSSYIAPSSCIFRVLADMHHLTGYRIHGPAEAGTVYVSHQFVGDKSWRHHVPVVYSDWASIGIKP